MDGRLLAVPFWMVERAHKIVESASYQQSGEIGASRENKKRLVSSRLSRNISHALSTIQKGTASSLDGWTLNTLFVTAANRRKWCKKDMMHHFGQKKNCLHDQWLHVDQILYNKTG